MVDDFRGESRGSRTNDDNFVQAENVHIIDLQTLIKCV